MFNFSVSHETLRGLVFQAKSKKKKKTNILLKNLFFPDLLLNYILSFIYSFFSLFFLKIVCS